MKWNTFRCIWSWPNQATVMVLPEEIHENSVCAEIWTEHVPNIYHSTQDQPAQ
jgi:hypothetical protein